MRFQNALVALWATSVFARHDFVMNDNLQLMRIAREVTSSTEQIPTSTSNTASSITSSVTQAASSHTDGSDTSTFISSTSSVQLSTTANAQPTLSPTTSNITTNATDASVVAMQLPIIPTLTPALAIGGVLLMLFGLALCFVGIKHNGLQIFISTTLLLALAIEVLIIYVMNPPISNAIQGAYLVAGVIPGLIGGGVAMVFKEMTEGAGCFLGGFCFAMWLLCLGPGGLIETKIGRIILIIAFSIIAWSTNFSRYTRNYGIIVCTSFAGASALMLGVDCISRAGLKEFWMYLWDLNENVFPLGTSTYPVTRNIQVEEACVVIIAVLGVLTQFRIWKVIKEHRQKQDAARQQDEESRNILEAEMGRKLEDRNRRERHIWENTYGNGTKESIMESEIDSPRKAHISVKEMEVHETDLHRVDTQTSVEEYHMDDLRRVSADEKSIQELIPSEKPTSRRSNLGLERLSKRFSAASSRLCSPARQSVGPEVPEKCLMKDQVELVACQAETAPTECLVGAAPERDDVSDDVYIEEEEEEEEEEEPEEDRASSIAATAADEPDFQSLSRRQSQASRPSSRQLSRFSVNDALAAAVHAHASSLEIEDEDDDEAVAKMPAPKEIPASPRTAFQDDVEPMRTSQEDERPILEAKPSVVSLTSDALPRSMSRAAMNFRMDEWAKEAGRDAEPILENDLDDEFKEEPVWVERENAAVRARAEENNATPKKKSGPLRTAVSTDKFRRQSISDPVTQARSTTQQTCDDHPSRVEPSVTTESLQSSSRRQSSISNGESHSGSVKSKSAFSSDTLPTTDMPVDSPMKDSQMQTHAMATIASNNKTRPASRTLVTSPSRTNLLDIRNERIQSRMGKASFTGFDPRATTPDILSASIPEIVSHNSPVAAQVFTPEHGTSQPLLRKQSSGILQDRTKSPEDMTLAERRTLIMASSPAAVIKRSPSAGSMLAQQQQQHYFSPANTPTRRASQSAGVSPMSPMSPGTPQRLPYSNTSSIGGSPQVYGNARPRRSSTSYDASKQALIREQWAQSQSAASANLGIIQETDSHLAQLHAGRQQAAAEAAAREAATRARQDMLDQAMRMGVGSDSHRAALARMQAQANVGPSAEGSVYPPPKVDAPRRERRNSAAVPGLGTPTRAQRGSLAQGVGYARRESDLQQGSGRASAAGLRRRESDLNIGR